MKKQLLMVAAAIAAFSLAGCQDKPQAKPQDQPQAKQAAAPQAAPQMPAALPAGKDPHAGMMPQESQAGKNPHVGMKPQEMPAVGGIRKGKVITTMDAAGYTYVQVEEKGQKVWLAAMQSKVKAGDVVEFPDSQPMQNFTSKTLNRTFENIIFTPSLRVNGK